MRLPRWHSGKESAYHCRKCNSHRFDPWVRKIPWSRTCKLLQYSSLKNPMGRGAWRAIVHGITKCWA